MQNLNILKLKFCFVDINTLDSIKLLVIYEKKWAIRLQVTVLLYIQCSFQLSAFYVGYVIVRMPFLFINWGQFPYNYVTNIKYRNSW